MSKKIKFILTLPGDVKVDSINDIEGVVVWPPYSQATPITLKGTFNSYDDALSYAKGLTFYDAVVSCNVDGEIIDYHSYEYQYTPDTDLGYYFSYDDAYDWIKSQINYLGIIYDINICDDVEEYYNVDLEDDEDNMLLSVKLEELIIEKIEIIEVEEE